MFNEVIVNRDCRHFRGDVPCRPHKQHGVVCASCEYYSPAGKQILIIKLGAIGDVIRTTPLITKIKKENPDAYITWISLSPELLPSVVDKPLNFNLESVLQCVESNYDLLLNLDKDYYACALANKISAKVKKGFILKDNKPAPVDEVAYHKYLTGIFDDINKANRKSYLEEIFEIAGYIFEGEEYLLDVEEHKWDIKNDSKPIIGLNTGCGDRWVSRLLPDTVWIELIRMLQNAGFYPLLLGGKQEDEKNRFFAAETGAEYLGSFPLKKFVSLMDQTDLVVSAVTMGMHIAIGLKKPLVLMNNIFNPYEFELYGRGEIVEPDKECKCYFSPKCVNPDYFCLEHLPATKLFEAIVRSLNKKI